MRVKALLTKMPGARAALAVRQALRAAWRCRSPFLRAAAPGHFYSPIPDMGYIKTHRDRLFARDQTACPGVELSEERQIRLIEDLAAYNEEMPFPDTKEQGSRYFFQNGLFGHGSAIVLYCLMRHLRPRSIIEVGSGYSSAAMLDVNDRFFGGDLRLTFVEPYPQTLLGLLTEADKTRHRILTSIAQDVPVETFAELQAGDFLFVDSSHVAKIGSDVNFLVTEVLPRLNKGVVVHIHDIYWPFEYPEDWVLAGRAWNEAYLVKAFLQFNDCFEVLVFSSYLATHHQDLLKRCLPLCLPDAGSSLWLRKTR